jgi:tetratricopeptide (TPR) repeat protein
MIAMHHARLAALTLTLVVAATTTTARAEDDAPRDIASRVDTHLERGIEFFAEKQYELAIVEFRAGYALDPRAEFLFALAQAERLSGDCPTAVIYYKRFLETDPDPNQAEAARVNTRRCERALESGPGGRPEASTDRALDQAEAAGAVEPPPVAVEPARPAEGIPGWYRDPLGGVLLGGSVVGLGLGAVFLVAKASAETAAASAPSYDLHVREMDRARRNRTLAVVGFAAGAALGVVAGYRYLSVKRRDGRQLAVIPTAGSATGVALLGRF